jgi:hypothetical protein
MEKRQSARALQQRIQPKRDIPSIASWISYCKQRYYHTLEIKPKITSKDTLTSDYQKTKKCLVGLNAITKEAWNTAQNTEDKREKIEALSLAKECYSMN